MVSARSAQEQRRTGPPTPHSPSTTMSENATVYRTKRTVAGSPTSAARSGATRRIRMIEEASETMNSPERLAVRQSLLHGVVRPTARAPARGTDRGKRSCRENSPSEACSARATR